ncbi:MAG TPA: alpha/beta fold hydrolase [Solirubrobacterales bacterium]|nr:alpha/beta fold hydrolase [Solirubrobacterales bacterium]
MSATSTTARPRPAEFLRGAAENRKLFRPGGPRPDPTPADGPDPYGSPHPEWLRIDWREHLRTIDVGGARVNYVEMGEREAIDVVFVHGLSGCWQNWLENIPHFARQHRVLALDLPGFGGSPMPPWEISIEAYGRLLLEFLEALGVGDCVVVGNSMGGFVSAQAATQEPDRLSKLVLASSAGVSHARMRREPIEALGRMIVAVTPLTLKLQQRMILRPRVREATFTMVFHHPNDLRLELLWEFMSGAGKDGFLPAFSALAGYDILDRLEDVPVPTLIVWGRNDLIIPPGDALQFARRLRNSQTVIFDDCGHVPMAERPLRFNRTLEAFLARET